MENNEKYKIIKRVVDKYFDFMNELDANHYLSEFVPKEMADTSKPSRFEGTLRWNAISSTVSDNEIKALEEFIGNKLPNSYKYFIQYRNFIEMYLGEYQAGFFKNISSNWLNTMKERIEFYPFDLIERSLIPVADYSDFGVICFNAKETELAENEYPLIWLDHEDGYEQEQQLANNFVHLFQLSEPHLDEWIRSNKKSSHKSAK